MPIAALFCLIVLAFLAFCATVILLEVILALVLAISIQRLKQAIA